MFISLMFISAAVIVLLLDVWAIVSVFRSNHGVDSKALWSLLIVFFPIIGLAIWGIAGPRGVTAGPGSPEHSK